MRKSQAKLQAGRFAPDFGLPTTSKRSGTAATRPPPPPHGDLQEPPAPAPHTQVPARPSRGSASSLETRTRQLYRAYREKRATPAPTPTRAARASRRPGYPSRPARGSNLCLRQRKRGAKAGAGVCTQASGRAQRGLGFTSSSKRLGRSAPVRQGGNNASTRILDHRPAWSPASAASQDKLHSRLSVTTPWPRVFFAICVISSTSSSDPPAPL